MKKRGGVLSLGMMMGAVLTFFSIYFYIVDLAPAITNSYVAPPEARWLIEPTIEEIPGKEKKVTFAIAGDIMLDRAVWHYFKGLGLVAVFEDFDETIFKDKNFALLNLEGPISREPINDDWQDGSMIFNFPPESMDVLKHLGIDVVSLANNHSQNAGISGLANTKEALDTNDIRHFGKQNGFNWDNVVKLNTEIPISLVGINTLAEFENGDVVNAIRTEKADGQFVIVMPHWGKEYQAVHNANQERFARSWIEAGTDMIVGSHSHVVQDFEVIDNVPVIYSLGNFVFDQMFSKETQEGLIVIGAITSEKLTLTFNPTKQRKIYVDEMTKVEANTIISDTIKLDSNTIELSR